MVIEYSFGRRPLAPRSMNELTEFAPHRDNSRGSAVLDENATGAPTPLPAIPTGAVGRESHERNAALARGAAWVGADASDRAAAEMPAAFALLADNVRDYAVFLLDPDGRITFWGEGARLMKWWSKPQAQGAHLRLLYPDGGSEDGTAESHLQTAVERGEYTGEGHRVRSDGSTFWAAVTLTALRDRQDQLLGFAKVTRD
jgi:PAS domain S-box-containing protein